MAPTSPLRITAMALDLGNVLVKVDHYRFCRGLAGYAGPHLTPEEVFAAVFDAALEPGYDTGRISSIEFYQRIMSRFRLALPYPAFCRLWTEIFDPMEGMSEVVAHLGSKYPLFLLSNTNSLHFDYIRQRFPLLGHFLKFILSYQVGSRKPESGIYHALIREVGHPPQQILFLDDKLPFVEAARSHGLTAWPFTTPQDLQKTLRQHGLW
ncbi:MAG: HAD family phosphatase [Desulfobaccales bacterium]|nr:HAD family phosphatase [Desulfobaccales bacterium]